MNARQDFEIIHVRSNPRNEKALCMKAWADPLFFAGGSTKFNTIFFSI